MEIVFFARVRVCLCLCLSVSIFVIGSCMIISAKIKIFSVKIGVYSVGVVRGAGVQRLLLSWLESTKHLFTVAYVMTYIAPQAKPARRETSIRTLLILIFGC